MLFQLLAEPVGKSLLVHLVNYADYPAEDVTVQVLGQMAQGASVQSGRRHKGIAALPGSGWNGHRYRPYRRGGHAAVGLAALSARRVLFSRAGQVFELRALLIDPLPHGMTIWEGWMWYCDDVGIVCKLKL